MNVRNRRGAQGARLCQSTVLLYCNNMANIKSRARRSDRPTTASGERIYAIGDIHGRYDLFREILRNIDAFNRGLPTPQRLHIVLLGDVVDRGPDSAKLLKFLKDWTANTQGQVLLQGNHEDLLLRVRAGERRLLRNWLQVGGRETLESFGMTLPGREEPIPPRLMVDIAAAISDSTLEFVRRWPTVARSGDYFFCHAGVRPGVELSRQSRTDLMWIRNEFLDSDRDHGAVVVHGHSISAEAETRFNRIGIDTGAYRTGMLTALYLDGDEREFIVTEPAVDPMKAGAVSTL